MKRLVTIFTVVAMLACMSAVSLASSNGSSAGGYYVHSDHKEVAWADRSSVPGAKSYYISADVYNGSTLLDWNTKKASFSLLQNYKELSKSNSSANRGYHCVAIYDSNESALAGHYGYDS